MRFLLESAAARVLPRGWVAPLHQRLCPCLGRSQTPDARRLEVVADGLPLFGGGQLFSGHRAGVSSER